MCYFIDRVDLLRIRWLLDLQSLLAIVLGAVVVTSIQQSGTNARVCWWQSSEFQKAFVLLPQKLEGVGTCWERTDGSRVTMFGLNLGHHGLGIYRHVAIDQGLSKSAGFRVG